jgi:hypothetical protein
VSELSLAIAAGPAHRNSGLPRLVDVTGHLYVGGSGVWEFAAVQSGRSFRLRSEADVVTELVAGIALAVGDERTSALADEAFGESWQQRDVEAPGAVLREIGRTALELDVSVVVTDVSGSWTEDLVRGTAGLPWSVVVASPVHTRLHDGWQSPAS